MRIFQAIAEPLKAGFERIYQGAVDFFKDASEFIDPQYMPVYKILRGVDMTHNEAVKEIEDMLASKVCTVEEAEKRAGEYWEYNAAW